MFFLREILSKLMNDVKPRRASCSALFEHVREFVSFFRQLVESVPLTRRELVGVLAAANAAARRPPRRAAQISWSIAGCEIGCLEFFRRRCIPQVGSRQHRNLSLQPNCFAKMRYQPLLASGRKRSSQRASIPFQILAPSGTPI